LASPRFQFRLATIVVVVAVAAVLFAALPVALRWYLRATSVTTTTYTVTRTEKDGTKTTRKATGAEEARIKQAIRDSPNVPKGFRNSPD